MKASRGCGIFERKPVSIMVEFVKFCLLVAEIIALFAGFLALGQFSVS